MTMLVQGNHDESLGRDSLGELLKGWAIHVRRVAMEPKDDCLGVARDGQESAQVQPLPTGVDQELVALWEIEVQCCLKRCHWPFAFRLSGPKQWQGLPRSAANRLHCCHLQV